MIDEDLLVVEPEPRGAIAVQAQGVAARLRRLQPPVQRKATRSPTMLVTLEASGHLQYLVYRMPSRCASESSVGKFDVVGYHDAIDIIRAELVACSWPTIRRWTNC
jgi:hypothetical protein